MKKVNTVDKMFISVMLMASCFVDGVVESLHDEDGAVDIVAVVVLIGIAVVVAVIFRKQIENLINSMFNAINGKANEALN